MNKSLHIERILPVEQLEKLVSEQDRSAASRLGGARRRAEWLMWRAIVCRELPGAEIGYDDAGAPVVENYPVHVSVAHCTGWVAVVISDGPCAVDIEPSGRDLGHTPERFATERELALGDPLAIWCGKEALYKYAGRRGLDFRRDLHIERIDGAAGTMTGRIEGGVPIRIKMEYSAGYIVAYIL